jgi:flavodoxin
MKKALIVVYSRSGHTQKVAEAIAAASGWPLAMIECPSHRGLLAYPRLVLEVFAGIGPRIKYDGPPPSEFDLVILGAPIWAAHIASPMRSFAQEYAGQFKEVAFFCCMGGSGSDRAFAELEKFFEKKPLATVAIKDEELGTETYRERTREFADRLKKVVIGNE